LKQKINWWQIITVLILIAGAIVTVWSAYQQDATLRSDLLTETRLAELGIGTGQVTALSGSASDITSPDYRALKVQLERIRLTTPHARFAYLMGQRLDGSTGRLISQRNTRTSVSRYPNGRMSLTLL
jgi:drug/metabolite transporter (DMT)-like permease